MVRPQCASQSSSSFSRGTHAALIFVLAAVATGCAPSLSGEYLAPGPVEVGAAKTVVWTEGYGLPAARDLLAEGVANEVATSGYFALDQRQQEVEISLTGAFPRLDDDTSAGDGIVSGSIYLRVDVVEWATEFDTETKETVVIHESGAEQTETDVIELTRARVSIFATLLGSEGQIFLNQREYRREIEDDTGRYADELRADALQAVVAELFADVTPERRAFTVVLDDSDPSQADMIQTALDGNLADAISRERAYVEKQPTSAAAVHNLAAMLDVTGAFEEALRTYDEALTLGGQDFYRTHRDACAERLRAQRALSGGG